MSQRGDTIVEVLISFAVFATLAIGTTTIMSRSLAMAEQGLETTLVRQQIDAQADLLRYARDTRSDAWEQIKNNATTDAPAYTVDKCMNDDPAGNRFIVTRSGSDVRRSSISSFAKAGYYSKIDYNTDTSEGMWIQAVRVNPVAGSNALIAYDMHIRACWESVGRNTPIMIGTIVRLYE